MSNIDTDLTRAIKRAAPGARHPMEILSLLGEPLTVLSLALAGFLTAVVRGQSEIQTAFVMSGIAFALNIMLKLALRRARPHGLVIRNLGLNSYSFPSGHAFGTTIFYGLFALLDIRYLSSPWNGLIACSIGALIFLIGVSRVYTGAHYPSDVMAGWLLGGVSLAIVNWLAF